MLADLFTKPLDAKRSRMLLTRQNYHFSEGRHHLALKAYGLSQGQSTSISLAADSATLSGGVQRCVACFAAALSLVSN